MSERADAVSGVEPAGAKPPGSERRVGVSAVLAALVLGAIIGGMAVEYWFVKHGVASPGAQQANLPSGAADDLALLKRIVPTQSHTMQDVGYFWASLWFAAQKNNWPLASYFFKEARQAVRWTVLIRPVRQLPDGGTVDIRKVFDTIDPTAFAAVQLAVEDEDLPAFTEEFKKALTACHSCHSQAGLPFLRPVVPTTPPGTILTFEK